MQLKTIASVTAGAVALLGAAQAQDNYVSISGGASFLNNSDNEGNFNGVFTTGAGTTIPGGTALPVDSPVGWTTEFDTGFAVSGAYGQAFAQTLQQSRGFGPDFRFGETAAGGPPAAATAAAPAAFAANNDDDEDDLYSQIVAA
eukprot:TRINITY_DN6309_c0_g3_i2.p3 TRINITY_DN6309_c0_g3~~TRINITY_DN6309_c0_g3_i2.p3  ORF type:complete len:144 (+),score=29.64 TRINITY_DN6309_c0_g3_i2:124-555(+)